MGVAIHASRLLDFIQQFRLGADSTIGVLRLDGRILAMDPPGPADRSWASDPLFTVHLPHAARGIHESHSALDGQIRLTGYRRIEGLPLVVVASVPKAPLLNEWRGRVLQTGSIAVVLFLIFVPLAWLAF